MKTKIENLCRGDVFKYNGEYYLNIGRIDAMPSVLVVEKTSTGFDGVYRFRLDIEVELFDMVVTFREVKPFNELPIGTKFSARHCKSAFEVLPDNKTKNTETGYISPSAGLDSTLVAVHKS